MTHQELSGDSQDSISQFLQSPNNQPEKCYLLVELSMNTSEPPRSMVLRGKLNPKDGPSEVHVIHMENGVRQEEVVPHTSIDGFLKAIGSNRGRYRLFPIEVN